MAGHNAFLQRQEEVKQHYFDVGQEIGMQKMWAMYSLPCVILM